MIRLTGKIIHNTPNVICMGTDGLTYRHIFSPDSGISSHSFGRSYLPAAWEVRLQQRAWHDSVPRHGMTQRHATTQRHAMAQLHVDSVMACNGAMACNSVQRHAKASKQWRLCQSQRRWRKAMQQPMTRSCKDQVRSRETWHATSRVNQQDSPC